MTVVAFDTLAFANKLKGAGMNPSLADVQAEETAKILTDLTANQLVTKQDLKNEIGNLKMDMYGFTVKVAMFTVSILGGIQALFHYMK
jgi:hypothetical protein